MKETDRINTREYIVLKVIVLKPHIDTTPLPPHEKGDIIYDGKYSKAYLIAAQTKTLRTLYHLQFEWFSSKSGAHIY